MKPVVKSLAVAAIQVALVLALGGKFLIDRHSLPRVWVKTRSFDPDLPVRGRYATLQLEVDAMVSPHEEIPFDHAQLSIENGKLVARSSDRVTGVSVRSNSIAWQLRAMRTGPQGRQSAPPPFYVLQEPVAFFLSQYAADPTRRMPGEELWVEVSIPKKGPPRPIQLGVEKDGKITPLNLN